jgi:hypothetical protein
MKNILLVLLVLGLWACEKDEVVDSSTETFLYTPTQCAEKWNFGQNDAETMANFKSYLKMEGIEILSMSIAKAPSDFVTCLACTCSSGRLVTVKANKDYSEKLTALKFNKK